MSGGYELRTEIAKYLYDCLDEGLRPNDIRALTEIAENILDMVKERLV